MIEDQSPTNDKSVALEARIVALENLVNNLRIEGASGNAREGFAIQDKPITMTAVCNDDGTITINANT